MKLSIYGWAFVYILITVAIPATHASSRSEREHGAELFKSSGCVHCHTIDGTGGNKGPDLSSVGRVASTTVIRKHIVDGGKSMPAFGEVLQPNEIDDLVAYLRSCRAKPKK